MEQTNMPTDKRAEKLADLVLDHSVSIQKADRLLLQFDPAYKQYARLIGEKAKQRGAEVRYDPVSFDPAVLRGLLERYDMHEWQNELGRRIGLASWCNARVLIDCSSDPDYAKGVQDSEARVAAFDKEVNAPDQEVLFREGPHRGYGVKWNLVGFPCQQSAKNAGMTLGAYADLVYSATIGTDWKKMCGEMERIKAAFDGAEDVHIVVPGSTDLHLSLKARGGEICDGKFNMPDGEVCYGPVEDSVNGHIYFQAPTRREGFGLMQGIRLEFKDGVIRKYSAEKNQKALDRILEIDDGIKKVGEFGIGCNYGIIRPSLEVLFDEKIGGTIHLALGDSYKQPLSDGGGLNKSAIHWDLVCDLRRNAANLASYKEIPGISCTQNLGVLLYPGGRIYVDGRLVQENGVWRI